MNPQPKKKPTRLKGKDRTKLRIKVGLAALQRCQLCGGYAPIYDQDGLYNPFVCGQLRHVIGNGAGGPDTEENTEWWCVKCHTDEHAKGTMTTIRKRSL